MSRMHRPNHHRMKAGLQCSPYIKNDTAEDLSILPHQATQKTNFESGTCLMRPVLTSKFSLLLLCGWYTISLEEAQSSYSCLRYATHAIFCHVLNNFCFRQQLKRISRSPQLAAPKHPRNLKAAKWEKVLSSRRKLNQKMSPDKRFQVHNVNNNMQKVCSVSWLLSKI
jgi:hypothetical protein